MDVLLDIIIYLTAFVGIVAAALLVLPIGVSVSGEVDAEAFDARYDVRATWGGWFITLVIRSGERARLRVLGVTVLRFDLRRGRRERKGAGKRAGGPKKRQKPGRASRADFGLLPWAILNRGLLWRAILSALAPLHLRGNISGVVGLPEPDDTVWLAIALREASERLPGGLIDLEVDYADAVLEARGRFSAWVIPIHLLATLAAIYLFSEAGRAWRRRRRATPGAHLEPAIPAPNQNP